MRLPIEPQFGQLEENTMSLKHRALILSLGLVLILGTVAASAQTTGCEKARTITVHMSALDQPFFLNRLGALMPEGMVFALDRDIVPISCPKGQ